MPVDCAVAEFARVYHAEVIERSQRNVGAEGGVTTLADFKENVFTSLVLSDLAEAGIVEDAEVCFFAGTHGSARVKVNGYTVSEDGDRLDLVATIFTGTDEVASVSPDTVRAAAERAARIVRFVFQDRHLDLEPSSEAFSMTCRISEARPTLSVVRVFVIVDGTSSLQEIEPELVGSLPVRFQVWDIERLHRSLGAGQPHATIEIDLVRDAGAALRCLPVPGEGRAYSAYLCVIPGDVLYRLYDEFGSRLLELNVRSFLQARGKVNSKIRETIRDDPTKFFAYNNGLSLTASEVRLGSDEQGHAQIEYIRGLQVVNGGQTTASIHRARKIDRFEIDTIFVQAKLTVVPDEQLEEMVPKISKYANSQNAVNDADFSANDPYHVELERLANTTWTPGERSRWFYERARGQYQVQRLREGTTDARRRTFDERVPASQKIVKTDLAKYLGAWDQRPHLVSRGNQKNFVLFMDSLRRMGRDWLPDVEYFKDMVAKAILFKTCHKVVGESSIDAYKAQTAAYTVALLVAQTAGKLDLRKIWDEQAVPEPVRRTLGQWAPKVYDCIVSTAGTRNVGEWCKSESCWHAVRALDLRLPSEVARWVLASTDGEGRPDEGRLSREDLANIAAVKRISSEEWMQVFTRAIETRRLSLGQRNACATLSSFAAAGWLEEPSAKQAKAALVSYQRIMHE